jgi:hypothetical protein
MQVISRSSTGISHLLAPQQSIQSTSQLSRSHLAPSATINLHRITGFLDYLHSDRGTFRALLRIPLMNHIHDSQIVSTPSVRQSRYTSTLLANSTVFHSHQIQPISIHIVAA